MPAANPGMRTARPSRGVCIRLLGLVARFSLRVREVPGSSPEQPHGKGLELPRHGLARRWPGPKNKSLQLAAWSSGMTLASALWNLSIACFVATITSCAETRDRTGDLQIFNLTLSRGGASSLRRASGSVPAHLLLAAGAHTRSSRCPLPPIRVPTLASHRSLFALQLPPS